jgi:hypothetical protein
MDGEDEEDPESSPTGQASIVLILFILPIHVNTY